MKETVLNQEMKQCKKCKQWKPFEMYSYKRPKNRKPGLQPRCKSCCSEDTRIWNLKNKETSRERYLQRRYQMSENEYDSMLLFQNNRCLLCDVEFNDTKFGPDFPVVDHCHTSGKVRGILCNECNRGLGYFHDNPEALSKAASYVQNTKEF